MTPRGDQKPETLVSGQGSATQRAGAARGVGNSGTKRRQVYDAIERTGTAGITFEQLAEVLRWSYSHVGPRTRELRADGHVTIIGTRKGRSGATQDVYAATRWAAVIAQHGPAEQPELI